MSSDGENYDTKEVAGAFGAQPPRNPGIGESCEYIVMFLKMLREKKVRLCPNHAKCRLVLSGRR